MSDKVHLTNLIKRLDKIQVNHHDQLKNILSMIEKQKVPKQDVKYFVNELNKMMEDYVIDVIDLVDGVKKVSIKHFKEILSESK